MKIKYSSEKNEDRVEIYGKINNELVSYVACEIIWDMTYDLTEDEIEATNIDEIFKYPEIVKIESLKVHKHLNMGYATDIMQYVLRKLSNKYTQFYLNAYPQDTVKDLNRLTKFYKKFGFKTLLNQGNNELMYLVTE